MKDAGLTIRMYGLNYWNLVIKNSKGFVWCRMVSNKANAIKETYNDFKKGIYA